MKVVEIVPRERTRLYGMLVAKEAAIRKGGRGTYVRVGRKTKDATRWKHRNYRGSVQLKRAASEVVTAKVQNGGDGVYILDNRTGRFAVFTWDNGSRRLEPRTVRPLADAFVTRP